MKTLTKEIQAKITPEKAVELLVNGNNRFVNNIKLNRNLLQQVNETSEGQFPFAAILSCSDSRTSAELVFDQGLGDIFSVRLAGNIASVYAIGSLEFACKYLGTKIIMVLGHSECGAVKAACDHFSDGLIDKIIDTIKPAAAAVKKDHDEPVVGNREFVAEVTIKNVQLQIHNVLKESKILREMVTSQEIGIVGGVYNISTGLVVIHHDDIYCTKLLSYDFGTKPKS